MELSEFLKLFLKRDPAELTETFHGLPWDCWKYLLRESKKINYGCSFSNGVCTAVKNGTQPFRAKGKNRMCCCCRCASNVGYLRAVSKEDLPLLAMLFNCRTGFWRWGQGCILPQEVKSEICVRYRCDAAKERIIINPWHKYLWACIHYNVDMTKRFRKWYLDRYYHDGIEGSSLKNFQLFLDMDFLRERMKKETVLRNLNAGRCYGQNYS